MQVGRGDSLGAVWALTGGVHDTSALAIRDSELVRMSKARRPVSGHLAGSNDAVRHLSLGLDWAHPAEHLGNSTALDGLLGCAASGSCSCRGGDSVGRCVMPFKLNRRPGEGGTAQRCFMSLRQMQRGQCAGQATVTCAVSTANDTERGENPA